MPKIASSTAVEFGARIRERRTAAGLSQEGLAALANLHWTYIGQIERGQRNITIPSVLKLAHGLGVDAGQLITGLETPPSEDVEPKPTRRSQA